MKEVMMPEPKLGKSKDGKPMHYSVGALIQKNGKYLLINRINPPPGFAGLAGHIDEGEEPKKALIREVKEESALCVASHELLFVEELDWNWCKSGVEVHKWYLFECEVKGAPVMDSKEANIMGWFSDDDIRELQEKKMLEEVWEYWFEKLRIL